MVRGADIPAVVPAAGHGVRMRSVCGDRPKELLPVAGRAAIEYALAEALEAGIRRVAVVVRPDKPLIEKFLSGDRPETLGGWSYAGRAVDYRRRFEELLFVEQPRILGVAEAVTRAREALGAEAVACLMPDNVVLTTPPPIASSLEAYRATGLTTLAAILVGAAEAPRFANCGGFEADRRPDGWLTVRALHDKGPGSFPVKPGGEALRAIGRIVVSDRFFELLEGDLETTGSGELDDMPVYQALAERKELLAAPIAGEVFDLGHPVGYEALMVALGPGEPGSARTP